MAEYLYLAEYERGIFRVGVSKSSSPNLRRIRPYYINPGEPLSIEGPFG